MARVWKSWAAGALGVLVTVSACSGDADEGVVDGDAGAVVEPPVDPDPYERAIRDCVAMGTEAIRETAESSSSASKSDEILFLYGYESVEYQAVEAAFTASNNTFVQYGIEAGMDQARGEIEMACQAAAPAATPDLSEASSCTADVVEALAELYRPGTTGNASSNLQRKYGTESDAMNAYQGGSTLMGNSRVTEDGFLKALGQTLPLIESHCDGTPYSSAEDGQEEDARPSEPGNSSGSPSGGSSTDDAVPAEQGDGGVPVGMPDMPAWEASCEEVVLHFAAYLAANPGSADAVINAYYGGSAWGRIAYALGTAGSDPALTDDPEGVANVVCTNMP